MALTINPAKAPGGKPAKPAAKSAGKPKSKVNDYSNHLSGPPTKMTGKQGSAKLQITKKSNISKDEQILADENLPMESKQLIPNDQLAMVHVGGSQTVNTGNYESVKITVSLTLPSGIHDLDDSYEFASNWVSKKMEEAISGFKG